MRRTSVIRGLHIYKNDKGQTIYYDVLSKKAYIINKKDETLYLVLSRKLVIAIFLGLLVYFLSNFRVLLSIIIAAVIYIALFLFFRLFFIKNLNIDKKFQKDKTPDPLLSIVENTGYIRVIFIIILSVLIAGIGYYNLTNNDTLTKYTTIIQYVYIAFGLFFFTCGITVLFIKIFTKKK